MAKTDFDKNMEKVSAEFDKVADDMKDAAKDASSRWGKSPIESKISMLLGVFFLICALIKLRLILWGVVLLIIGVLCVCGFFDQPIKDIVSYSKKTFKDTKKAVSSTARSADEGDKPAKKTSAKK